jgi:hypothetical protein
VDDELINYAVEKLKVTRMAPSCPCKICAGESIPYDVVDLNKSCESPRYPSVMSMIPVIYRMCRDCGFIFTDFFDDFSADQWKKYIYNDDYSKVDPEYKLIRPRENASMLRCYFDPVAETLIGLDYGGGNGVTAALLRKEGWAYDSYDPFGHTDVSPEHVGRYNVCTAIEVFEHTPDPVSTMRAILEKVTAGRLLVMISTAASDGAISDVTRLAWWYAAPRNGHVSLYSHKSLHALARRFDLMCTIFKSPPFLLTRGYGEREARMLILRGKLRRRWRTWWRKRATRMETVSHGG